MSLLTLLQASGSSWQKPRGDPGSPAGCAPGLVALLLWLWSLSGSKPGAREGEKDACSGFGGRDPSPVRSPCTALGPGGGDFLCIQHTHPTRMNRRPCSQRWGRTGTRGRWGRQTTRKLVYDADARDFGKSWVQNCAQGKVRVERVVLVPSQEDAGDGGLESSAPRTEGPDGAPGPVGCDVLSVVRFLSCAAAAVRRGLVLVAGGEAQRGSGHSAESGCGD